MKMSEEYAGHEPALMGEEPASTKLVEGAILYAVLALKTADEDVDMENRSETAGEEMLKRGEIANLHADIEGSTRLGEAWEAAKTWAAPAWEKAQQAFDWAKAPSTTYPQAVAKAAVFSIFTTVFLAPIFLARNCYQVYLSRQGEGVSSDGIATT